MRNWMHFGLEDVIKQLCVVLDMCTIEAVYMYLSEKDCRHQTLHSIRSRVFSVQPQHFAYLGVNNNGGVNNVDVKLKF